jgi:hypothetical protein
MITSSYSVFLAGSNYQLASLSISISYGPLLSSPSLFVVAFWCCLESVQDVCHFLMITGVTSLSQVAQKKASEKPERLHFGSSP